MAAHLRQSGHECFTPGRGDSAVFSQDLGRVFYCIGLTADYATRPFDTIDAHVSQLARVLKEGRFERLVYLSSTRLYDTLSGGNGEEDGDIVLNPNKPRHLYDLSKALGENLCINASAGRGSVARLSCVYDPAPNSPGFLSKFLSRLAHERAFTLESSSGVVRDYVALSDVVAALCAILQQDVAGIVNVASGENVSNQDIIDVVNSMGWRIQCARETSREKQVSCDVRRLRGLGVEPTGVRDFIRAYMGGLLSHALD